MLWLTTIPYNNSGTTPSPPSSSARPLVSPLAWFSQSSSSSGEHGPPGLGSGLEQEELGRKQTVRMTYRKLTRASANFATATFKRGGPATGREGLRLVRT